MISKESYFFDCLGLFHKRNVFTAEQVGAANQVVDECQANLKYVRGNLINEIIKYFGIWESHPIFLELANHPAILELCRDSYGGSASFRLDHAFIIDSKPTDKLQGLLHGCSFSKNTTHYYLTQGQQNLNQVCWTRVGQLSVAIVLKPQSAKTGGFCFIPGSHKTSYFVSGQELHKHIFKKPSLDVNEEHLVVPDLNPGDLIAFPESLIHGQTTMAGAKESRRFIYNMFCPLGIRFMDWSAQYQRIREHTKDEKKLKIIRELPVNQMHLDPYYIGPLK